eukprot:scaffold27433_cov53-Cyclotella_meneghiniana.AAC.2
MPPKATALTALLLTVATQWTDAETFCPVSYQECTNGLFNAATCKCYCISPYCPDASGDCLNPTGYCGGNHVHVVLTVLGG